MVSRKNPAQLALIWLSQGLYPNQNQNLNRKEIPPLFKSRDLCSQSHWQNYWWTEILLNMATSLVISLKCRLALYVCVIYCLSLNTRYWLDIMKIVCLIWTDTLLASLFFEVKLMELGSVQPLKNQAKWQYPALSIWGFTKALPQQFSALVSFPSLTPSLPFPASSFSLPLPAVIRNLCAREWVACQDQVCFCPFKAKKPRGTFPEREGGSERGSKGGRDIWKS